ncbi:MAG: hypothetical protein IH994_07185 [Proteobacteria bacterium]|nr:hypothetical protein [Pseudomonadota bacterium]
MVTALGRTRNDLGARLPALIEAALRRYEEFTDAKQPPTEAKAFAAHAAACRAAMAHLEQLLKLALSLNGEGAATPPGEDINRLIADAEAALEKTANDT